MLDVGFLVSAVNQLDLPLDFLSSDPVSLIRETNNPSQSTVDTNTDKAQHTMDNCAADDQFGNHSGCEEFFDGLVCWPFTIFDHQARVNCLEIKAFAQALKFVTNNEIGIK